MPLSPKLLNKNLVLLMLCQGLFLINNVTFIAINGLVGLSLSTTSWMATLPVMGYVVGGACSTTLVAMTQNRFGRQRSFQLGLLVAAFSSLLCAFAAYTKNFWLLTLGTFIAGYYSANGQLYRFAATELVEANLREKAVSWLLAGGLIGAVVGPNLASWTRNVFDTPFLGAYLALTLAAFLGLILMYFVEFPKVAPRTSSDDAGRPISVLIRQPIFFVATLGAALGYGIMNLLMAATPLAMQVCGYPFANTALVLEWHVIGMFAPGFFTGSLLKRYGILPIMCLGLALNCLSVVINLTGTSLQHFLFALFVLGVGWNFLFTGATSLAMLAYRPEEKDKAQAFINFWVFAIMAMTSFSSGALITTHGWSLLNIGSLVPITVMAVALVYALLQQKKSK